MPKITIELQLLPSCMSSVYLPVSGRWAAKVNLRPLGGWSWLCPFARDTSPLVIYRAREDARNSGRKQLLPASTVDTILTR